MEIAKRSDPVISLVENENETIENDPVRHHTNIGR